MLNLGGLAIDSFGTAIKQLDDPHKENVRGVFRQDNFVSGLLMSAPAVMLSLLLLFCSDYFHTSLLTCSKR